MKYSSRKDTLKHIWQVRKNIFKIILLLFKRALFHDRSKLKKAEKRGFDEYTPKLANCTYGSEEYKEFLKELKLHLDHHYANNRHHPEHFKNGIKGMNLVDLIEMFCDWYAATKRHNDGDILKSIEINKNRFGYSDDLNALFENTYKDIFWCVGCKIHLCREFPGTCVKTSPGKEYIAERIKTEAYVQ